jgi:RNA polymerase sigma-70 factor, ECF subfamily
MRCSELEAFHAGERSLYRRLVESHSHRLLATAMAYLNDSDEAEDAVQTTWVRAYEKRRQLQAAGSLGGWLHAILRNVCHTEARRAKTRASESQGSAPATEEARASHEVEHQEVRSAIAAAIAGLPERQRDTVVLRVFDGRSTRETAELLGCAEGTVKATLHHALKKLNPILRNLRDVVVS